VAVSVGVLANAAAVILGRHINHRENLPPVVVTAISMGVGGFVLLAVGLSVDGFPHLTWKLWAIIAWLALVNTAFAFTLWNHTQRTLSAVETSLINNTILVQIALLVWFFLGESVTGKQWLGILLLLLGVALLQLSYRPSFLGSKE
jgi:drug/metabolite transporter (DMT)-like permease